jgi:putative addiction module component (TIGR02574 family)
MSERTAALLSEAMKLSDLDREELAIELFESLDSDSSDINSMTEAEFQQELNRRHDEFLNDPGVGIPFDEVKRLTRIE